MSAPVAPNRAAPASGGYDHASYWGAAMSNQARPAVSQAPGPYKSRFDAPQSNSSAPSAYPHLSGSAAYPSDKQPDAYAARNANYSSSSRPDYGAPRPQHYEPRPEYGAPAGQGDFRGSFRGGPRGRADFRGGRGDYRGSFRGSRGDFHGPSRGAPYRGRGDGAPGSFRGSFRGGDRGGFRGMRGDFRGGRGDFRGGRGDFRGAPRGRGSPYGSAMRPDSRFDQERDHFRDEHDNYHDRRSHSRSSSPRSRSRSPPRRDDSAMHHGLPSRQDSYRFGGAPPNAVGPQRNGSYPPPSRDGYSGMHGQAPGGAPSAEMYAAMMQAYQQYGQAYPAAPPAYPGYSAGAGSGYPPMPGAGAGRSVMGPYGGPGPAAAAPNPAAGSKRTFDRDDYRGASADPKRMRT